MASAALLPPDRRQQQHPVWEALTRGGARLWYVVEEAREEGPLLLVQALPEQARGRPPATTDFVGPDQGALWRACGVATLHLPDDPHLRPRRLDQVVPCVLPDGRRLTLWASGCRHTMLMCHQLLLHPTDDNHLLDEYNEAWPARIFLHVRGLAVLDASGTKILSVTGLS